MDEINEILRTNLMKFKKFNKTVVNPATISQLVDEMGAV